MFARILVPLDGSRRSERAMPYAAHLARALGSELVLLYDETVGAKGVGDPSIVDPVGRLGALATMLEKDAVKARVRIVHGAAADAILTAAEEEHVGAIVMSTHGRSGLGRWLYGSVADEVLRRTTRPILLVTAASERIWSTSHTFRILVPLDGSAVSESALGLAGEVAERLTAELVLLRVAEPVNGFGALGTAYLPAVFQGALEEARQYLDGISTSPSLAGRTVTCRVESGDPAATIASVAHDEHIDLIVMATHGSGGLVRLTMGSVATATLHRATAPVLLVRAEAVQHAPTEAPREAATTR